MGSYKVEFCRSALKDLRRLDRAILPKIIDAIENLAQVPRPSGVRKLSGAGRTCRIRVGDYRVIYNIDDAVLVVAIVRVRHRREAYN